MNPRGINDWHASDHGVAAARQLMKRRLGVIRRESPDARSGHQADRPR